MIAIVLITNGAWALLSGGDSPIGTQFSVLIGSFSGRRNADRHRVAFAPCYCGQP